MYAIIDIGSNTIRLNVYQVEEDGAIHSIFQSKETAGLAGYVQEDGSMSREGLDRAADALLRFRSILDALHIENRAVFATASLRNITNSEEAVFQLQERTGLMIRLLSGREEAILDYVGATPIPGFQLRYIYFIDKSKRKDLTVPEIPFSKIDELGAGMYKGEKITFAERHSKVTPEE